MACRSLVVRGNFFRCGCNHFLLQEVIRLMPRAVLLAFTARAAADYDNFPVKSVSLSAACLCNGPLLRADRRLLPSFGPAGCNRCRRAGCGRPQAAW